MTWTHEHSWKFTVSPDRVFAALTDPAELTRWFAERVDIQAQPGGNYRFWGKHSLGTRDANEATQRISRLEAGRILEFSWSLFGVETQVAMALASDGDGSRLTLHHEVKGDLAMPRPKELIDDHWRLAFGNLTAHLAGGTGLLLPDFADPSPEIRIKIIIDAPKETVFRALIQPELINRWFGTESAFVEPRKGGRYELSWKYRVDGRDVLGGPTRILELVPNEKLVLDWPDWRGDPTVTGQWISFSLESAGEKTQVTFVHGGFGRTSDLSDYGFGWTDFLEMLVEAVTRVRQDEAG